MDNISIERVAKELNERAQNFRVGKLQSIRSTLSGRRARTRKIFHKQTIKDEYAFHDGGRSELQFNIGLESDGMQRWFRYGAAFSFELSQHFPSIEPLIPKVRLFNEYINFHPEQFSDLRMWHYDAEGQRSPDHPVVAIESALVRPELFVFIGDHRPLNAVDYDEILSVFDRLMPVYEAIENGLREPPTPSKAKLKGFQFRAGCHRRSRWAVATQRQKKINVTLRHNEMVERLFDELEGEHGKGNVATEHSNAAGGQFDCAVNSSDGLHIYEIKTAPTVRICIREALGQLLEYALWPGTPPVASLTVVGEAALDADSDSYIDTLNERFPLSLFYRQISLD